MTDKPSDAELQKQFKAWFKDQPKSPRKKISDQSLRDEIKRLLGRFNTAGGIQEYALLHKWLEISESVKDYSRSELNEVYRRIWVPTALSDYRRIQPELIEVNDKPFFESIDIFGQRRQEIVKDHDPLSRHWNILRTFVSSQPNDGSVGRSIRFLVRDKRSQKYLGVVCVSSEFLALKMRNEEIGIDDTRWKKINNHSANGSTIIPVQPFGSRYLGGKLLALLCLSDVVAKAWERRWGNKLVSVTTTNLWASIKPQSQYDGLEPYWSKLGTSSGSSPFKPTEQLYRKIREWMCQNYPFEYWLHFIGKRKNGMMLKRDNKNRALIFCYRKLGFKKSEYESGHTRGIYFSRLYKNTDEFLRGGIVETDLTPAFDNSVAALTDYWRFGKIGDTTIGASNRNSMTKGRILKLQMEKKFSMAEKPEWYRSDAFLSFEDFKTKNWSNIGR
jgi:hypothetical protein